VRVARATIEARQYTDKKTGKIYTRYKAKIRLKAFPYEEATFDRKTDAQAWAGKREYELQHQQMFGSQAFRTKTLTDLLCRYEDGLRLTNPKRYEEVIPVLRFWKSRLGKLKICHLSKDVIIGEREKLKASHIKNNEKRALLSNASVNRKMAVLKRALNVAVDEWDWLPSNPMDGIKALPEPKGRTRFLQEEELKALVDACNLSENNDLLATVVLAITTGARRGEIEKIRLKNINFKTRKILLPTSKSGKPRMLHLADYANDLVSIIVERAKPKQVYLFASPHNIERSNDFRTAWRTAIKRASLEDFKFHDLRHSAASFYAMYGAGLHQIAEILGHSSLQVTKRYTHLLESETARVVMTTAEKVFSHGKTEPVE